MTIEESSQAGCSEGSAPEIEKRLGVYPGITKAALVIAYDNGGINCFRSEEQMRRELVQFLARWPDDMLGLIDAWLAAQTDDDLDTICCGEHEAMNALMANAPPGANDLLDNYFEQVC